MYTINNYLSFHLLQFLVPFLDPLNKQSFQSFFFSTHCRQVLISTLKILYLKFLVENNQKIIVWHTTYVPGQKFYANPVPNRRRAGPFRSSVGADRFRTIPDASFRANPPHSDGVGLRATLQNRSGLRFRLKMQKKSIGFFSRLDIKKSLKHKHDLQRFPMDTVELGPFCWPVSQNPHFPQRQKAMISIQH